MLHMCCPAEPVAGQHAPCSPGTHLMCFTCDAMTAAHTPMAGHHTLLHKSLPLCCGESTLKIPHWLSLLAPAMLLTLLLLASYLCFKCTLH
jgi:hypothetical protein